jgi:hypothetical protein
MVAALAGEAVTEAPLHPRRLAAALKWLKEGGSAIDDCAIPPEHHETIKLSLKLILNSQRRVGLTPEAADIGSHVLGVVDYVKKALTRK